MRRLIIIRKDLNLRPGKLIAMSMHLAEAYWTNLIKKYASDELTMAEYDPEFKEVHIKIPFQVWKDYVNGIFTKTVCEAKNLNQLKKVESIINDINSSSLNGEYIKEGVDWGYINDKCLTDLTPENEDGTTTVGVWFRPLSDEIAHKISKKYKLYGAFDKSNPEITYYEVCESSYCSPYDNSTECRGKYSSYEEAKKHFDYLVNNVKSDDFFKDRITSLTDDECKYNDGNDWSYSINIYEKTEEGIRDKFIVPNEN